MIPHAFGDRLVVGRLVLAQVTGVRIPVPEPMRTLGEILAFLFLPPPLPLLYSHSMSEQIPFTPNTQESDPDIVTPELLEQKMLELWQRLKDAADHVEEVRQEVQKTGKPSVHGWIEFDPEASERWREARKVYAELVEDTANQELRLGENIPVPDGAYIADLEFTNYKKENVKKKLYLYYPADHTHLASMLKAAWGELVGLGIHNFGFKVPDGSRMGICSIVLHGPEDFSYHSRCFVDASGRIIRRQGDVK